MGMNKTIIIGVHGLANKPPEKTLEKWWRAAILEGIAAVTGNQSSVISNSKSEGQKMTAPNGPMTNDAPTGAMTRPLVANGKDFDFEILYWADLMYVKPLKEKSKPPFKLVETYQPSDVKLIPYKAGVLDWLRESASDKLDDMLDRVGFIDHISHSLLALKLKDLAMYWNEERAFRYRKTAKQVLCGSLKKCLSQHQDKKIILIAHSMGSIISYDTLIDNPDINIDTFITIGSPLGLPRVKRKALHGPRPTDLGSRTTGHGPQPPDHGSRTTGHGPRPPHPLVPTNIKGHWYNFADRRDAVAIDTSLREDYLDADGRRSIIDKLIYNQYTFINEDGEEEGNSHKSYGYLRCPEVARAIKESL